MVYPQRRRNGQRTACGAAQISEFGAALFLLLSCIVLPLLNMAIIPVRYAMGKSIVGTEARTLARSESFSEALKRNSEGASRWAQLQAIGGIAVKDSQLAMTIESTRNKHMETFKSPRSIPASWLPEGSETPCVYLLDLRVSVEISPLVSSPWPQGTIPGLTGPIPIVFRETAAWENLSRDPVTGEFFINQ